MKAAIIVTLMGSEIMAGTPDIAEIIRDRAIANGVDPDTLLQIGRVESGLNPDSANPASSARGLFQQTTGNWKQYGNGGDPHDPYASADAGARFLSNNQRLLQSAGLEATPGALYLSHFAGPGGALKVLRADPSAPVSSVLDPAAVKANPFLAKMTVADLQAWADRKMGGGGAAALAVAPDRAAGGMQVAANAPSVASSPGLGAPGTDPAASELSPELMAQLNAVKTMLAKQQQPLEPVQMQPLPDHAAQAKAARRARIVQSAISGSQTA